jgi:hypothetical protein
VIWDSVLMCATGQIFGCKTQKGVTIFDRQNIKMTQLLLLNYALKIIVLKSKAFIKVKIIHGLDFFSQGLKLVPDWQAISVRSWQH